MSFIKSLQTPFYTKLAMILFSLIAIGYLTILGKPVLSPLLFSFLFATVLLPTANFFERKLRLARSGASGLAVFLMITVVGLILFLVGLQLAELVDDWPLFKEQFADTLKDIQRWISKKFNIGVYKQTKYLNTQTKKLASEQSSLIGVTIMSVSGMLLFLTLLIIDTFFILYYRRLIIKFMVSAFKEKNAVMIYEIVSEVQYIIRRYILGLLSQIGIVSVACCIALLLIGIRYPILLGVVTGLFNIIPYVGIFSSLAFIIIVAIGTAATTTQILLVTGAISLIHLLDSNVVIPFVVASKVKINALITVIGVFTGHMFWGIAGMFLALPIIAISKVVFDRVESFKAWGILLGDEKDEKDPEPLKEEMIEVEAEKHQPSSSSELL